MKSKQRTVDTLLALRRSGVELPTKDILPEVVAAIIRLTRGNFRVLARLLTQMERVIEINRLSEFSLDVVQSTRENLVIGQAKRIEEEALCLMCAK